MRYGLVLLCLAALSGCAFHKKPYAAYEGSVELSETTVFVALDENAGNYFDARVLHVDGNKTSCVQAGCPYWVRVLPGRHDFDVRYTVDWSFSAMGTSVKYIDLSVELTDMQPRHVYVARYVRNGDELDYAIEDLGENPDFGLVLGLKGVNQDYYGVEF